MFNQNTHHKEKQSDFKTHQFEPENMQKSESKYTSCQVYSDYNNRM